MNEKKVIISLYQNCSGRSNVPLFIAEKNNEVKSLFNFIHHDFDELRKESLIEFDSTKKTNRTNEHRVLLDISPIPEKLFNFCCV